MVPVIIRPMRMIYYASLIRKSFRLSKDDKMQKTRQDTTNTKTSPGFGSVPGGGGTPGFVSATGGGGTPGFGLVTAPKI